jgi:hypothetical protein
MTCDHGSILAVVIDNQNFMDKTRAAHGRINPRD